MQITTHDPDGNAFKVHVMPRDGVRYMLDSPTDSREVELERFCATNDFPPDEIAELFALAPGESVPFGGGAGPLFVLRCEALL